MEAVIEELQLSGDGILQRHGEVYELLGLDVIYDRGTLKIYSTRKAKITSTSPGIHIHTSYKALRRLTTRGLVNENGRGMPLEMMDMMGNKIVVTFSGQGKTNRIAIVTSGGDAPGMNSAIKSITRTGIKWGASVYGVYNGYDGLINNNIRRLSWDTETHCSSQGGTVLLSARSQKFMGKEGRKEAVLNMVRKKINCVIVLGGDGSMKGAMVLRDEFKDHLRDLIREGKISPRDLKRILNSKAESKDEEKEKVTTETSGVGYSDFYGAPECYKETPMVYHDLNSSDDMLEDLQMDKCSCEEMDLDEIEKYVYDLKVVGIPATIDNDICGVPISLGEDTAIHRVIEGIDHLMSTMKSHTRTFVIEVMGRKCGWIALMSALASSADYVLLPEAPTEWKKEMIEALTTARRCGKAGTFVIVSEGAVEKDGTPIHASQAVEEIAKFGMDVRLLKLGHIQRGGPTSAQDRIYGTLLGVKAVEISLGPTKDPVMISIFRDEIFEIELKEVIERNNLVRDFQEKKLFEDVLKSRCNFFRLAYSYFRKSLMTGIRNIRDKGCDCSSREKIETECSCGPDCRGKYEDRKPRIGVLQFGRRASGMNTVLNAVVQYSLVAGAEPYYIPNGFEGLVNNQLIRAKPYEFFGDVNNGGSAIGVGGDLEVDIKLIQRKVVESGLDSLIIIGGSKALNTIKELKGVNIVLVPASSYNNIPKIDISIGADTALNTIIKVSDVSKLNSFAYKNNVFVVEIGGENCGYLSLMGGIAAGAFEAFIPERKYLIGHLSEVAQRLRVKFREKIRRGIVIFRNERTFRSIPTSSLCEILKTDSGDLFETNYSILGDVQQGLNPSPIDRINATILGIEAVDLCLRKCGVGVVGFSKDKIEFTEISEVLKDFDHDLDRVKNPYWLKYSNICRSVE
ncbi:6-phosphofructokinase [Encephalitozoon intestinalis ATCC 50506]|uniref:6-phosphofructokinase n=1 Tax=Encephalitozoon intestinalis (strain ATCC 50506) TaxID=876142 RepID=E0S668_ENCIT|nr:6-phosphofructokinase [Encephalitozoon intestinalis ATCC 50506]ADM11203.1 6-phosphofructokinase [Encephalitozoon intestinalis ATCC 50506]UTX44870.1 phosphofructokinase [Encephalitozoon intestinalis]